MPRNNTSLGSPFSKMTATIKACIEADWLKLQQKSAEEGLLSYYIITKHGKGIIKLKE